MSVVIIGGHDRMVSQYKKICRNYKCKAKVFTQMSASLDKQIGSPDLLVLFTNTVSHKMIRCALGPGGKRHGILSAAIPAAAAQPSLKSWKKNARSVPYRLFNQYPCFTSSICKPSTTEPAMHLALSDMVKQFSYSLFLGSMSAILNPFTTGYPSFMIPLKSPVREKFPP